MSAIPDLRDLAALVDAPLGRAIGWALLQFIWQGALIGALAAITLAVMRRSAADVRYVVATIALSLMLTIPVVTALQALNAGPRPVTLVSAVTPSPVTSALPATAATARVAAAPVGNRSVQQGPSVKPAAAPSSVTLPMAFDAVAPWLLLAWTLGVLVLTARLFSGWLWIRRLKSHGASPAGEALRHTALRLAKQLHVSRTVRLIESSLVEVPTVIGWLKPIILLPASALAGLSPVQLEAILAHELAHIRRHDYLVNLLQTLVETLLFYHPAVWWVSRQIRIERENCCDDLAVSLCGDPVVYAQALADLEQLRGSAGQLVMAASGGSLVHRVRRLLGAPSHAGRAPGWLAGGVAVVVIVAMAGIVAGAMDREERKSRLKRQSASSVSRDSTRHTSGDRRWSGESQIRHGADQVRQGAEQVRQGAESLRRGANDIRRSANDLRREANDLRRHLQASARALHAVTRALAKDVHLGARSVALAIHDSFPQIPPPPPLPPDPPDPPEPPEPPDSVELPSDFEPLAPLAPMAPPASTAPMAPMAPMASTAPMAPMAPMAPLAPRAPFGGKFFGKQRNSGNFTWSNDGEKLEANYRGEIEFTDDDADVKSLSSDGWLRIRWNGVGGNGPRHTVEFRPNGSGGIERRFWAGNTERPFEPEGRKWLADVLPRFIRRTGIGAAERAKRIYRTKGAQGVLSEITLVEGSWAKRLYFSELLKMPGLDTKIVQQALAQAGRELDSDFELASLLISTDELVKFDDATRKTYMDTARSIGSDFEMRRVFSSALKEGPLSPAVLSSLLDASVAIGSDFEQASLLIDVAKLQPIDDATRAPFFKALDTVESDFEHRRVLSAVMARTDLSPAVTGAVVDSAATIGSDFENASLLLEVAKAHPIEGTLRAPFFRVLGSIQSTFERGRVLQAVGKRTDASEQTVLEVIKATQGMGHFEAAQVLLIVAGSHPLSREARDAYIDAADKLGDFEQGRVLAALVKNEKKTR